MSKKYEVQTNTICNGWVNCWHEDEKLLYFDTNLDAINAIYDFVEEQRMGVIAGYLSDANDFEDYRVVVVNYD
jgi:hypothetical protein